MGVGDSGSPEHLPGTMGDELMLEVARKLIHGGHQKN
jgi:hypothetical protein